MVNQKFNFKASTAMSDVLTELTSPSIHFDILRIFFPLGTAGRRLRDGKLVRLFSSTNDHLILYHSKNGNQILESQRCLCEF